MRAWMIRFSCFIGFFSVLLAGSVSLAIASSANQPSHIIVEAESGAVIAQQGADLPWYPASLTKMMTLYLTFDALKAKKLSLSSALPVSQKASAQPAMKLGVKAGESVSVRQAVNALAAVSANDIAVVLAEHLAGSERAFVKQMNQAARRLKMLDTHFENASGLPHKAQVTSARDMAILARALLNDFPQYYHFFSSGGLQFNGQRFVSHNGFVARYPGADGFKTGYTCGSGYNLVASAMRKGVRMIVVVLGANSVKERTQMATKLMDKGFHVGADAPGAPLLFLRRSVPLHELPPIVLNRVGCADLSS